MFNALMNTIRTQVTEGKKDHITCYPFMTLTVIFLERCFLFFRIISASNWICLDLDCISSDLCYALQAESELVKIDINCHIQGDIVLECLNLHDDDMAKDDIMYQAMFNTAFIKSNTLVLNRDEIDVSWDIKDQFSKDFKAEVFFFTLLPLTGHNESKKKKKNLKHMS